MPAWWEDVAASDAQVNPQKKKKQEKKQTPKVQEVPNMVFERYQRKYWRQKCKECTHKWLWPCDKKEPLAFCPKCQAPWSNLENVKPKVKASL